MIDELDEDSYDWRCFYCGQGFFDGADRFVVDQENCCEGCMDGRSREVVEVSS